MAVDISDAYFSMMMILEACSPESLRYQSFAWKIPLKGHGLGDDLNYFKFYSDTQSAIDKILQPEPHPVEL